jgi:hypothetical protein
VSFEGSATAIPLKGLEKPVFTFFNEIIDPGQIRRLEEFDDGKLGTVFKATYDTSLLIVRKVDFDRVSRYVLEELNSDIEFLQGFACPNLLPVLGSYVQDSEVGILTPYMPNGSLYNILHVHRYKFMDEEKVRIAVSIAE